MSLTKLQQKLCNILQQGIPICPRPFAEIAGKLGCEESEVLRHIEHLKEAGVIRRISAIVNYGALGRVTTLVTAEVPEEKLQEAADAVNSLENVSHNYLRRHRYNLWFTLQGEDDEQIEEVLGRLRGRFGIDFYSLPVRKVFKLDVRFDAEGEEQFFGDEEADIAEVKVVELNEKEMMVLSGLQNEFALNSKPFDFFSVEDLSEEEFINIAQGLIEKGVIRRIAGIVNHRKLGFIANLLFVCEAPDEYVVAAGRRLARFRAVSHCYERETFGGWPYNLFAMMHGRSDEQIQKVIKTFTEAEGIKSFELLPTVRELKKQPVKLLYGDLTDGGSLSSNEIPGEK
ncbi:hypothetical protein ACFL1G_02280 [Planctomycetota bacterium]